MENNIGFTLLFVGALILLTLSRTLYPKRFIEFISLPVSDKYFALEGKGYEVNHPFHILLFLVQCIAYSTFIYLYLTFFQSELKTRPWLYIQILTAFGVFVLFKYYFEKLVGYIVMIEGLTHRYLFEKLNYSNLIALVLLALNLLAIYTLEPSAGFYQWSLGILITLHLISLISSIKRNYQLIFKNIFYFILYLCALEIAPYIILYQLVR